MRVGGGGGVLGPEEEAGAGEEGESIYVEQQRPQQRC